MGGTPETLYARDGNAHIAYQVLGDGPDLLFVPTPLFPIDLLWDEPTVARQLHRLASFSRLILGLTPFLSVEGVDAPTLYAWRPLRWCTVRGTAHGAGSC
jgi:hypothetical protein